MTIAADIETGAARAFFASAWADAADAAGALPAGCEIMVVMPQDIDPAAIHAARTLVMDTERKLRRPIADVYAALPGGLDAQTWGHYLAMQSMGHGVGLWEYDIDIDVPYVEFGDHSLSRDYFPEARQMILTKAEQFFYDHAGYSYHPETQTPEQGRAECARQLAAAEAWAREEGYSFAWQHDPDGTSADWTDEPDPYALWVCDVYAPDGDFCNSLGGIDFGRDGQPWGDDYRRVVEAELAVEAMK